MSTLQKINKSNFYLFSVGAGLVWLIAAITTLGCILASIFLANYPYELYLLREQNWVYGLIVFATVTLSVDVGLEFANQFEIKVIRRKKDVSGLNL